MLVLTLHFLTVAVLGCTCGLIAGNLTGRYLDRTIGKIHKISFLNYDGSLETVWLVTKQTALVDLYAVTFKELNAELKDRIAEIESNKAEPLTEGNQND